MFIYSGSLERPHKYLEYRQREMKVLEELKVYGKVKEETLESYIQSKMVYIYFARFLRNEMINE